jgi:hypothetical protein
VSTRGESGQILPLLAVAMVAILAAGWLLFQVGAAATLKTEGQTAADAAALAGANEVKLQIELAGPEGLPAAQLDVLAVCARAEEYASRNGADLEPPPDGCQVDLFDVRVRVRTRKGLDHDAAKVGRENAKAEAKARAHVQGVYGGLGVPGFGGVPGIGGGGPTGGPSCMSEGDIKRVEDAAGVTVGPNSALRTYCGNGNGGVSVSGLVLAMQVAIAKAEKLLGHPLALNSGYRTVAYQAQLCQRVSGPCAPPGSSMHNFGMAIDVANPGELVPIAGKIGLCQPLPGNDAVHFSLASDRECGGVAGALGAGQAYGGPGGFAAFLGLSVRLVKWDGL